MAKNCEKEHCSGNDENVNNICKAEGWPVGHLVLLCDKSTGVCCNCKCSCFKFGTLIAVANSKFEAVENIKVNDMVMASGAALEWNEVPVTFSNGTSGNSNSPFMLKIVYLEKEEEKELICTPDQPFLKPSKLLKRADKLMPGDLLVLADGMTAEVKNVNHVTVTTGLHHISTSNEKPTSLENHLLNVQGVVAADYVVQLFQNELKEFFEIKTTKMRGVMDENSIITPHKLEEVTLEEFVNNGTQQDYSFWGNTLLTTTLKNPDDSFYTFVTNEQAEQIKHFVPKLPIHEVNRVAEFEYLAKIFKVFYPEITILLDWYSQEGNAFVMKNKGQFYIILQGGLARCEVLSVESLAIIIAHEIGHIYGGNPKEKNGYSCDSQADFYGVYIVMRKIWFGDLYPVMTFPGIEQIKNLFSLLKDTKNEGQQKCYTPTLDCRIEILTAGITSLKMPQCSSKKIVYLNLIEAEMEQPGEVTLYFSESLDIESAQKIQNYAMFPTAIVQSAEVMQENLSVVKLKVDLEEKIAYKILVSNIVTETGNPLDPEHSCIDLRTI